LSHMHMRLENEVQGVSGHPPSRQARVPYALLLFVSLVWFATGCRTPVSIPPANLSEPRWTIHQGQAVWRPRRTTPEIAGELLLARSRDGRSLVQFIKTPFPILTGQTTLTRWQIEFPPQHRSFSGHGKPPARLIWLHVASCLFDNATPPKNWVFERMSPAPPPPQQPERGSQDKEDQSTALQFRFENKSTGETLEGFLNP